MEKKKIILVDDHPANLTVCKKTLKDLYEVYPAPSAEKMFEILERVIPELILLDVEMPVMNGYDAMRKLKSVDAYKDIPVIFLSAMDDAESEIEGLELGAVDYIHKPVVGALLCKRIETHIALIEGRKELITLNNSIGRLLAPKDLKASSDLLSNETEAIFDLLKKDEIIDDMALKLREPLTTIIEMIEKSIKSDDIDEIKHLLGRADVETRLIKEIVEDIIE
ncbi:MAG: response regulator [Oscillospiraceae bacterium]|nr:response regulator [Oscillospiraceae bacterium]